MKRALPKFEAVKTFGGTALGATMLLAGWTIYSNNGYSSSLVFFLGMILLPTGLYTLASGVTGGFGESPRSIIATYRQHLKHKRKYGQA